jgi:hypothetical protein
LQARFHIGETEGVAILQGDLRDDANAVEHDAGKLAECQPKGECRGGQNGRTMDSSRKGPSEIDVPNWFWAHGIHRPGDGFIRNRPQDQARNVIDMDAAHPLAAIAERASEAHLEKRKHESHGSTRASHKADAKPDDAHSFSE